jgi:hypothetical protein
MDMHCLQCCKLCNIEGDVVYWNIKYFSTYRWVLLTVPRVQPSELPSACTQVADRGSSPSCSNKENLNMG